MRGLVRLSTETDRVYTINLGKVLLSPNNRRAKRAINMIREFARHHMGISEVKIDMDVSHIIWSKGIRSPPRKIRVRMRKTDEGNILISKYEADPTAPSKVEDAKAKPDDTKEIPVKDVAKADAGSGAFFVSAGFDLTSGFATSLAGAGIFFTKQVLIQHLL